MRDPGSRSFVPFGDLGQTEISHANFIGDDALLIKIGQYWSIYRDGEVKEVPHSLNQVLMRKEWTSVETQIINGTTVCVLLQYVDTLIDQDGFV